MTSTSFPSPALSAARISTPRQCSGAFRSAILGLEGDAAFLDLLVIDCRDLIVEHVARSSSLMDSCLAGSAEVHQIDNRSGSCSYSTLTAAPSKDGFVNRRNRDDLIARNASFPGFWTISIAFTPASSTARYQCW
jgi:hypothetical protein